MSSSESEWPARYFTNCQSRAHTATYVKNPTCESEGLFSLQCTAYAPSHYHYYCTQCINHRDRARCPQIKTNEGHTGQCFSKPHFNDGQNVWVWVTDCPASTLADVPAHRHSFCGPCRSDRTWTICPAQSYTPPSEPQQSASVAPATTQASGSAENEHYFLLNGKWWPKQSWSSG